MSNEIRANRGEINRLNKAISAEEQTINAIFQSMGQTYFAAHRDDPEESQAAYVQGVLEAMNRIKGYKDQINVLRGIAICPNCQAEVSSTAAFCSCCGTRMPGKTLPAPPAQNSLICPNCGNVCQPGTRFCKLCGTRLAETAAPAAPAPQQNPIPQPAAPAVPQPAAPIPEPVSAAVPEPVSTAIPEPLPAPAPAAPVVPQPAAPIPEPVSAAVPEPVSVAVPEPVFTASPEPIPAPAPAAPAKKICPYCGTELNPEYRFCLECGSPV